MPRVIITHLTGSKADTIEEFDTDTQGDIVFGRDSTSNVRFSEADDTVSRSHLHIVQDTAEPNTFILVSIGRNGTFINQNLVSGTSSVHHGDIVSLGRTGPQFRFELALPPPSAHTALLEAPTAPSAPAYISQESPVPSAPAQTARVIADASFPETPERKYVGRDTMERNIKQIRSEFEAREKRQAKASLTRTAIVGMLVIAVAAALVHRTPAAPQQAIVQKAIAAPPPPPLPTWEQIARDNTPSVVLIRSAWRLLEPETGNQLYVQVLGGRLCWRRRHGIVSPLLTTSALNPSTDEPNEPLRGSNSCTGFVASAEGIVVTSKHVLVSANGAFRFAHGKSVFCNARGNALRGTRFATDSRVWYPEKYLHLTGLPVGRVDYIERSATFAGQTGHIDAAPAATSATEDIALVKIPVPAALRPVNESKTDTQPAVGEPVMTIVLSRPERQSDPKRGWWAAHREMPAQPVKTTVKTGSVNSVGRPEADSGVISAQLSTSTIIQHDAVARAGSIGSPVFDKTGVVIAINVADSTGLAGSGYAIPIKCVEDLQAEYKSAEHK